MSACAPAIQHQPQFTRRAQQMFGVQPREARRICIVSADSEPLYRGRNQQCRCKPGAGRHYTRSKVDGMVATGQMAYAGQDKRVAYFVNPRTWAKTYVYAISGEVISCGLQMVPGGYF